MANGTIRLIEEWGRRAMEASKRAPEPPKRKATKPRVAHPDPRRVTAVELERDVLAFIAERYADRHLDIMTAQLGLSNAARKLIFAHMRAVAYSREA